MSCLYAGRAGVATDRRRQPQAGAVVYQVVVLLGEARDAGDEVRGLRDQPLLLLLRQRHGGLQDRVRVRIGTLVS